MSTIAGVPSSKGSSKIGILLLLLVVVVGAIFIIRKYKNPAPDISFAPYEDPYSSKTDFAQVEYQFPLTTEQRMQLTPQNIQKFNQEQVDQIYARLTAGPIPDGPHDGDLFFPKGITGRARLAEIVGKVKGVAATVELEKLTILGRALWKGKVFYRNERVLRNRIDHLELLAEFFPNPAEEAKVRELSVNGKTDQLYFPAKLYCGQSLMDSRRESIIIDYAFTDEIEGYHEIPDKLAGREGLLIRDEVRMVRPGFYLGRAYMADSFLLNFTVYNDAAAKAGSDEFAKTGKPASEDCWVGPQKLAASQ
jgi:hypothetical protein